MRVVITELLHLSSISREGLKSILSGTNYRVVKSAADGHAPTEKLRRRQQSQTLFLIGTELDIARFAEVVRDLKARKPGCRVVVLADSHTCDIAHAAVSAGADAYLGMDMSREAIIKSLDLIMLGQKIVPEQVLQSLCRESPAQSAATFLVPERRPEQPNGARPNGDRMVPSKFGLSGREAAVLTCLLAGGSNKHIARELSLAEATVKVHVKAILRKLHVSNRTQAAMWAVANHWPQAIDADSHE